MVYSSIKSEVSSEVNLLKFPSDLFLSSSLPLLLLFLLFLSFSLLLCSHPSLIQRKQYFRPRSSSSVEAGSHSNCDEEAVDVQQLHPVTAAPLGHLSLSAPPTLHILAARVATARRRAFCRRTWRRSAPSALLVKPSLTPVPSRGVTLQMAAGWAAATQTCCHGVSATPEGPRQHLPSQSGMEPGQANIFTAPHASVTQLGNHPLPLSCLYLLPSLFTARCELLGTGYPVIFSPGAEKVRLEN